MGKKEPFIESDWVRVAPDWKFWNKQEVKTISCVKCDWKTTINRRHSGAMAGYASMYGTQLSIMMHMDKHAVAKSKKAKK